MVLGSVVVDSGWGEDDAGLLAEWHSCVPSVKGPEVLVVDEVGELLTGLSSSIVQSSPVVVTRVDLDWLHNIIRGLSSNNFNGAVA